MSEWHERLKHEVPRGSIPQYLVDLQALVSGLRRYRDDLKVPTPDEVVPLITPLLGAHPTLTVAYISDARYASVVEEALRR